MLLREMFSPVGGPKVDEQDIDWIGDLKFFIDNDDRLLNQYFFPAVKKHSEHAGNPNCYKLYINPIKKCLDQYCSKFEIEEPETKFSNDAIINLAKQFATEQEKYIQNGDYKSE